MSLTDAELLQIAAHLRAITDLIEAAGKPRATPPPPPWMQTGRPDLDGPGPDDLHPTEDDESAYLMREAKPADKAPCGCSLFARCDWHELKRRKGCSCNGPYASSMCNEPTHRARAERWPALDPSAVG